MSGAGTRDGAPATAGEPGGPQRGPGFEPGDGNKRGPTRGILITVVGALITAGIATITLSPGLIGAARPGPPGAAPAVTSKAAVTQQTCNARLPSAPDQLTGVVTGLISDEHALAITRSVEAQLGSKTNPAYPPLKHAWVRIFWGNQTLQTMAAIPVSLSVKIGDRVELNSRYRDPTLPCHFIPWTIKSLFNGAR